MTTPIAPSASPSSSPTSSATPENPNGILGKDDFLKLMVAQLQAQDPLQPASGTEYISELAQFTQVEQAANLASNSERSGAVQLIGHTVSYTDPTGSITTGKVQSVQSGPSGVTLTVEGVPGILQSSITEVS